MRLSKAPLPSRAAGMQLKRPAAPAHQEGHQPQVNQRRPDSRPSMPIPDNTTIGFSDAMDPFLRFENPTLEQAFAEHLLDATTQRIQLAGPLLAAFFAFCQLSQFVFLYVSPEYASHFLSPPVAGLQPPARPAAFPLVTWESLWGGLCCLTSSVLWWRNLLSTCVVGALGWLAVRAFLTKPRAKGKGKPALTLTPAGHPGAVLTAATLLVVGLLAVHISSIDFAFNEHVASRMGVPVASRVSHLTDENLLFLVASFFTVVAHFLNLPWPLVLAACGPVYAYHVATLLRYSDDYSRVALSTMAFALCAAAWVFREQQLRKSWHLNSSVAGWTQFLEMRDAAMDARDMEVDNV